MAKAISNIQYGDKDGNVKMFPAGSEVPDDVLEGLRGADWAVDDPLELDLNDLGEEVATIEISPGINVPNPKLMTDEEKEDFDEDGFKAAVESIRSRPLNAMSGEPSYGRIPGSESGDVAFLTTSNQRELNVRHREVVEKVKQAEKDRVPVGSAVAGQNPRPRAARITPAPGFKTPTPQSRAGQRAAVQAGQPGAKLPPPGESEIQRQQRELKERQEKEKK